MRVDDHVHICYIVLNHIDRDDTAGLAFRDLERLFAKETIDEKQV